SQLAVTTERGPAGNYEPTTGDTVCHRGRCIPYRRSHRSTRPASRSCDPAESSAYSLRHLPEEPFPPHSHGHAGREVPVQQLNMIPDLPPQLILQITPLPAEFGDLAGRFIATDDRTVGPTNDFH